MYYVAKRCVTLIEMMIVMFLIAMIIGVVAYNYQGSLEEGKAFKTRTAMEKLETILTIAVSENPGRLDDIESRWRDYVSGSPLVSNPKDLIRDGWGQEYQVRVVDGKVEVRSTRFEEYKRANPASMFGGDQ